MKYIKLIPNLDSRSPNKVALNIFRRIGFDDKSLFYTGKDIDSKIFLQENPVKLSLFNLCGIQQESIIHSHGFIPDCYNILSKYIGFKKKSFHVTTVHSLIDKDLAESKSLLAGKIITFIWCIVLSRMDKIFVLSEISKEHFIDMLGDKFSKNILVVGNGYDISYNKMNSVGLVEKIKTIKNSFTVVGTISVLRKMKGVQYLIRSLKYNENLFAIVVGDGPYMEDLKRLALKEECEDRVFFTGHVDDPISVLRELDVFCLLSDFEGFPISLLEAVANKVPCVCRDNALFRSYFPLGSYYLSDCDDLKKLSDIIYNAKFSTEAVNIAFDYYNMNYTCDAIAEKYTRFIIENLNDY